MGNKRSQQWTSCYVKKHQLAIEGTNPGLEPPEFKNAADGARDLDKLAPKEGWLNCLTQSVIVVSCSLIENI
jgi:hypothetical protein